MSVPTESLTSKPVKYVRFNFVSHNESGVVSRSTLTKESSRCSSLQQQHCLNINSWKRKFRLKINIQENEKREKSLQAEKSVLPQMIKQLQDRVESDTYNTRRHLKDAVNVVSIQNIDVKTKKHKGRPNLLRHHRPLQQQENIATPQSHSIKPVTRIRENNSKNRIKPQSIENNERPIMKPYKCEEEYEKLIREVRQLKPKPVKENKSPEITDPAPKAMNFLSQEKEEYEKLIREVRQLKQKLIERNNSAKKAQPSLPRKSVSFLSKEKEEYEKLINEVRQLTRKPNKRKRRSEKLRPSSPQEIVRHEINEDEMVCIDEREHIVSGESGEIHYVMERADNGEGEIVGEIEDDNGDVIAGIDEDSIEMDFDTESGNYNCSEEYLDLGLIDE